MTQPVSPSAQKAARRELSKAHTLDLLAEALASQAAHGEAMNLIQASLAEHTAHQMRLAGSFWARLKWIAVGR